MANALEDMRARLRTQLADTEDEVWDAGEKDDLLTWAVRRLNQRVIRALDPDASAQKITLVADTYFYAIDSGITQVSRVDLIDTNSNEVGEILGWEVTGDLVAGTAKMHVSPRIVDQLGTLRITGYGRYTLPATGSSQTAAIPDDYVTLVLAMARGEALRRMVSNRAQFKQWQVHNQVENISVNELLSMVSEADGHSDDEWAAIKVWQKPVEARI
jgi:hypothetical protein